MGISRPWVLRSNVINRSLELMDHEKVPCLVTDFHFLSQALVSLKLNVNVPPKILCWNPNPKCGIRSWGLWEGILLWECYCLLTKSCLTLCDSMECSLPRFLCPWDFPGKNTGVGCHFLLQGIFPTYGLNPGLLHCRQIIYRWSTWEAPHSLNSCWNPNPKRDVLGAGDFGR